MSFMDPLIALQDVDAQIYELEQELKDIPLRKKQEEEKLKLAQDSLAAAQDELNASQSQADDFALQAQASRERAAKLKEQQSGLTDVRALGAMGTQLDSAHSDIAALEEAQLNALENLPGAQQRVEEAKARIKDDAEAVEAFIKELDERLAEAKERLAALQEERKEAAAAVPTQHLRIYDRLRVSRRPTIVPLHDGVCGGCHLRQPPAIAHLIRRNNAIVTCQMCGRILY